MKAGRQTTECRSAALRCLRNGFLVAPFLLVGMHAARAGSYPDHTIKIVVPYGPGGNADLAARNLAKAASHFKKLLNDHRMIVVDKAGAGGLAGTELVQKAEPNGYTLLLARVGSQVVAPALNPITPYKYDDFTPIGLLQESPYACVVAKKSSYKTFGGLLAAIKAKPGKMSYASTGALDASVAFPIMAMLDKHMAATSATKVPYNGTPKTITAVLGGFVSFTCNGITPFVGDLKSGVLRGLVASSAPKLKGLPHIPTAGQIGMKNLRAIVGWSALYGPPHLPAGVVKVLSRLLARVKHDPQWVHSVRQLAARPDVKTPKATQAYVNAQYKFYSKLRPYIKVHQ